VVLFYHFLRGSDWQAVVDPGTSPSGVFFLVVGINTHEH